jgi:hypothetical protein
MQMMGVLLLKHVGILAQHLAGSLVVQMKTSKCYMIFLYNFINHILSYFSLLAKQLTNRLEEYKKCIWEIERTAESWSKNRAQSPQGK